MLNSFLTPQTLLDLQTFLATDIDARLTDAVSENNCLLVRSQPDSITKK